jgi:hypothetical protein
VHPPVPEATTSEPETAPPAAQPEDTGPKIFTQLGLGLAFLVGAAAFVVANIVLFLLAYPTIPNPGPQSDIRLPLYGLVLVVVAITFLFRRIGLAFGAGFAAGLVAETLFMSGCVTPWGDPGGTALRNAAYERQRPGNEAAAADRARARWISEVREHGLDLAVGVHRLGLATGCVLYHRKEKGEYPGVKDSLPDMGDVCWELQRVKDDETGWRVRYTRIPGRPGDPPVGFRIRAGPDAALRMRGPLLEVDYRGLILRRDSANAPAFIVGSPLQPITLVLMDCIRKASEIKPKSRSGVLTLYDLVFYPGHCGRIQLEQVKSDNGTVLPDPNIARLFLPTTRAFVAIPLEDISTSWDLTYVPHGKRPADGYDLHVRPMMYGYTGVRSYFMTGDTIHVTWEDRRATPSDPLAEECEIDPAKACGS